MNRPTLFSCVFFSASLAQAAADLSTLHTQAMQGDRVAQYQLAEQYAAQERNDEAAQWYQQSAEQQYAPAQRQWAWIQYIAHDYPAAAKWYTAAAQQGDAEAQFNLGLLYERGDGVAQDTSVALDWYRQAAAHHSLKAMTRLGWLYEMGVHVPKDAVQAARWYEQAATRGYAEAQFNLGALLDEQGHYTLAAQWYQRAANQHHAQALFNLAVLYQDGKGVPKDTHKKHELLQRAAQQGLPEAQAALP